MKNDTMIENWAHMLDEAFDKSIDDKNEKSIMPKDENEKFRFGDVFVDDSESDESIENKFDEIWPKWIDYFEDKVDKLDTLKLEGRRRDVDDWDVWEIKVEDCYDGFDGMVDMMFDDFYGRWKDDDVKSLKEIIDFELDRLIEEAQNNCELDQLETHGKLLHKGQMHWGGYYPG